MTETMGTTTITSTVEWTHKPNGVARSWNVSLNVKCCHGNASILWFQLNGAMLWRASNVSERGHMHRRLNQANASLMDRKLIHIIASIRLCNDLACGALEGRHSEMTLCRAIDNSRFFVLDLNTLAFCANRSAPVFVHHFIGSHHSEWDNAFGITKESTCEQHDQQSKICLIFRLSARRGDHCWIVVCSKIKSERMIALAVYDSE